MAVVWYHLVLFSQLSHRTYHHHNHHQQNEYRHSKRNNSSNCAGWILTVLDWLDAHSDSLSILYDVAAGVCVQVVSVAICLVHARSLVTDCHAAICSASVACCICGACVSSSLDGYKRVFACNIFLQWLRTLCESFSDSSRKWLATITFAMVFESVFGTSLVFGCVGIWGHFSLKI